MIAAAPYGHRMRSSIVRGDPKNEVDDHGSEQRQCQYGRTKPIIESCLTPHSDALRSPVESDQGIYHGRHGHQGEEPRRYLSNLVTEVEEADSEAAQNDCEVEP